MARKPISRVRRKKGAVLFAVISIMALLIAMASTAYFTARSSYNAVISNYSYSQLYLSAISVSDMVVEAVINNSTLSATDDTGADTTKNHYKSLRDAILALNAEGQTIYAYSENITDYDAAEEDIINELQDKDSTVPGVVDGVVVKIELEEIKYTGKSAVGGGTDHEWHFYDYKYKFTTDAYYRNNTISVEDIVGITVQRKFDPNDGTDGTPFIKGTSGNGGGNGTFSTFFTATGQEISGGKIGRTARTVKIKTHEISDDAFFQNKSTYFVTGNNNTFVGGVTSTGSVYLEKFTSNIQGDNNDWWIGEDLVFTHSNGKTLNLTDKNSLYVGNDLVIATAAEITAEDIYVQGDLYIMGQAKFTGNLHVTGNIYYEMPLTTTDEKGNIITTAAGTADADDVYFESTKYTNYANGWTVNGTLNVNGTVNLPSGETGNAKITLNNSQVEIPTGTKASTGKNGIGTYTASAVQIDYTNRVPDTKTDTFKDVTTTSSVSAAITSQVGKNTEYYNYTSPSEAYGKTVTVDFETLTPVTDDNKNILYYQSVSKSGVTIRTETSDLDGNVTVSLPYVKTGYMLDIDAESIADKLGENVNITYNIQTSDDASKEAMPIVLKDNITLDDGTKGFAWQGEGYDSNSDSAGTKVVAVGEGNIVFEMANIDESGKYVPYDPNSYNKYEVVTYVAGKKEVVGNEAQCDLIGGGGNLTADNVGKMLQSGTSTPKDEYQNQIMLVSNLNDGTAIDMARQNNAFCGYIYAPNAVLNNYAEDGATAPIFGGMIVSTYNAELSNLYYAEPKPSAISSMLGSLDFWSPDSSNKTESTPDTPATEGEKPDGNGVYLNGADDTKRSDWSFKGSNFVG